jgi:ribosomal protein L2
MAVRKLKPNTPGQRHKVARSFDEVTTSTPEKSILVKQKRTGGLKNNVIHIVEDLNKKVIISGLNLLFLRIYFF